MSRISISIDFTLLKLSQREKENKREKKVTELKKREGERERVKKVINEREIKRENY